MADRKFFIGGLGNVTLKGGSISITEGDTLDSDISRKLGISGKIRLNNKLITALTDPGKYLEEKNTKLKEVQTALDSSYNSVLFEYAKQGLTNTEAERKATAFITSQKKTMMDKIEAEYPTSVENLMIKKLRGNRGGKGDLILEEKKDK
jgi:hypothetical protein